MDSLVPARRPHHERAVGDDPEGDPPGQWDRSFDGSPDENGRSDATGINAYTRRTDFGQAVFRTAWALLASTGKLPAAGLAPSQEGATGIMAPKSGIAFDAFVPRIPWSLFGAA